MFIFFQLCEVIVEERRHVVGGRAGWGGGSSVCGHFVRDVTFGGIVVVVFGFRSALSGAVGLGEET